jgi:hypothetical protein
MNLNSRVSKDNMQASSMSMKNSGFFGGSSKAFGIVSSSENKEAMDQIQSKKLTTSMMDTTIRSKIVQSGFSPATFLQSNLKNIPFT